MNYTHAFHAGNHTEVFKHSVLCLLILELTRKATPFAVLDTHAGAGEYDLCSEEAQRTGEARSGIELVIDQDIASAATYLNIVRKLNPAGLRLYPGSPRLVQLMLRAQDRLIACELRENEAAALRTNFRDDPRVSIHHRNGYEAINALVPLSPNRGLVFIDPPFERTDELSLLANALAVGTTKWPNGIFAAWYPVKNWLGREVIRRQRRFRQRTLCCEFCRHPVDGRTLAGSGIVICNPPWLFEERLKNLCRELAAAFNAPDKSWSLEWWTRE